MRHQKKQESGFADGNNRAREIFRRGKWNSDGVAEVGKAARQF